MASVSNVRWWALPVTYSTGDIIVVVEFTARIKLIDDWMEVDTMQLDVKCDLDGFSAMDSSLKEN